MCMQLSAQYVLHNNQKIMVLKVFINKKHVLSMVPRFTGYNTPSITQVKQLLKTGALL
jgi:hypothetical protein